MSLYKYTSSITTPGFSRNKNDKGDPLPTSVVRGPMPYVGDRKKGHRASHFLNAVLLRRRAIASAALGRRRKGRGWGVQRRVCVPPPVHGRDLTHVSVPVVVVHRVRRHAGWPYYRRFWTMLCSRSVAVLEMLTPQHLNNKGPKKYCWGRRVGKSVEVFQIMSSHSFAGHTSLDNK